MAGPPTAEGMSVNRERGSRIIFENLGEGLNLGGGLLLNRLSEIPPRYWALAGLTGAVEIIVDDGFFWLWVLLAIANGVDWIAGRLAVREQTPELFSRKKSRVGLYSKGLGLIILGMLRGLEAILPGVLDTPSTSGYLAAVIGVALFIDELDSIDHHRQSMGKRPIPMLSWVITQLRDLTGAERRWHEEPWGGERRRVGKPLTPPPDEK